LDQLRPGMVFFDVGAHFGYFSLLASHLVGPGGSVHCFEPTPSTFGVLSENIVRGDNIRAVNCAMWSEPTTLLFLDYGVEFSSFNSVGQGNVRNNMWTDRKPHECHVKAMSVDVYCQENGVTPDFVKLDAEGAEDRIIDGMAATFARSRPRLTVEVGDADDDTKSKSRALLDRLVGYGYRPYEYGDGHVRPHVPKDRYRYDNLLFIPV
jgi:FkbM family methyltransferase